MPVGEVVSWVTGIVIFFLLLFTMAIGTNWVDNELALGALRATVAQAAKAGFFRAPRVARKLRVNRLLLKRLVS